MKAGKGEEDIQKQMKTWGHQKMMEKGIPEKPSSWRRQQRSERCAGGSFSSLKNSVR